MSEEKRVLTGAIGKVKWFNSEKGYGFITADDGTEYFIHYTGISIDGRKGYRFLKEEEVVKFDIGQNEKGSYATNVTLA